MSQERIRKLAAVMFADMVGFTALMGRDEDAAREQRDRQRDVVGAFVEKFGGQVRQFYGDGTLSVFGSAVEAAKCAVAIQGELRRPLEVSLRIGIHTGDIVDEGEGVYGDGVNVAARIESLAPPGGILVSDKVFDELRNQRDLSATSLGTVRLKNVSRPVEVFALTNEGLAVPGPGHLEASAASPADARTGSPLRTVAAGVFAFVLLAFGLVWVSSRTESGLDGPSVTAENRLAPSIAVLPFRNMSGEAENAAFFADGIHDDILTQLSKMGSLDVIARTSVMRYAGSEVTIPVIGRELGVAAILEGGVQRTGDRIRLNVQLIDTETDAHLWADTYDRELTAENIFAMQTEVAERIAEELHAVLSGAERRALATVPTESLEAYDLYGRGRYLFNRSTTREDREGAVDFFTRAVAVDPEYASAYVGLAEAYNSLWGQGYLSAEAALPLARAAAEKALEIDETLAEAHAALGGVLSVELRLEEAEQAFQRALALNPSSSEVHRQFARLLVRLGRYDESVREGRRAVELDPLSVGTRASLASRLFWARDYDGVIDEAEKVLALEPDHLGALYFMGAAQALRGQHDEGITTLRRTVALDPESGVRVAMLAWAYARSGQGAQAREILEQVEEQGPMLKEIAIVYGELGELDRAFRYLDRAYAEDPGSLTYMRADPTADALRPDPRFEEVLRKLGL